jgi:uncharacterized phiE125 gp8 family phage protein
MFSLSSVIAANVPEPLTKEEVKLNLRVTHDEDDALIRSLIVAAREYVELWTDRALVPTTVTMKLDKFPGWDDGYTILLPKSPVTAFTSITYYDENDTSGTLASTEYQADIASEPARVIPVATVTWPVTYERLHAVTLTYAAGYATPATVPERIKQAMHILIAHWYSNREPVGNAGSEIAFSLKALLGSAWSGSLAGTYAIT